MRCPDCKRDDEVRRIRRGPIGMMIGGVNPLEPYLCYRCWRAFWRPKVLRDFLFSASLLVFVLFLVGNAGVQIYLYLDGHTHRTQDRSQLFLGLDSDERCSNCGGRDISRSTLQPLDRIVSWLNPMTPYRCWGCWDRMWRVKPPFEAATNVLLLIILAYTLGGGYIRGRARRKAVINRSEL